MIYQYICPLCAFLFQVVKPYVHYKCPSCQVVVQALEYKPEVELPIDPDVIAKNWRMN